jgi:protein-S-isoprenylcysteine O-methyltransferase Ste14
MWIVSRSVTVWQVAVPYRHLLAGVLAVIGGAIDLVSVAAFVRARTTINPLAPSRAGQLVISGMFRFSRNPMYLGMLLILCGAAVWFGQPLNVLILALFVWVITLVQIKPEEAALTEKFGERYLDYCRRVRRWL